MNKKLPATIILAVVFFIFGGIAVCSAAQPQRVAILPVYFHSIQSDAAVGRVIASTLAERFHTPLASIVPVYDIIPPQDIAPVLPPVPADGKKVKLDGAVLAAIGEKLSADIVVVAEVTQYYTYTYFVDGDPMRRIHFEIRLLSFHKPTGVLFDKKDHEYHNGDDYEVVQPVYLAKQLTTALLAKVPDYR